MGGTVRMSEKEAIARGIIKPPDKTISSMDDNPVKYTPSGNKQLPAPAPPQVRVVEVTGVRLALYTTYAFLGGYVLGLITMSIIWFMNR